MLWHVSNVKGYDSKNVEVHKITSIASALPSLLSALVILSCMNANEALVPSTLVNVPREEQAMSALGNTMARQGHRHAPYCESRAFEAAMYLFIGCPTRMRRQL